MIPPKAIELVSTTTSYRRKSYHWKFQRDELDLSIENKTIYVGFGKTLCPFLIIKINNKYELSSEVTRFLSGPIVAPRIKMMFDDLDSLIEFVIDEYSNFTKPGQIELTL